MASPSEVMGKLLAKGRDVTAVAYLDAMAQGARMAASLADYLNYYEAIVTPAAVGVAPKGIEATGDPAFCTLWTLSGLPALSLPLLVGDDGMPLGVQLVGGPGRDARLLRTATTLIETLTPPKRSRRARTKS